MRDLYWWGIFLAASAGIACSYYHYNYFAVAALLGILAVAWHSSYRVSICIILGGFLTGMASYLLLSPPPPTGVLAGEERITVSGQVQTYPVNRDNKSSFVLGLEGDDPKLCKLQVFCSFTGTLHKGEQVRLTGKLKTPSSPGNPGEFDYKDYLLRQNIYYLLQIDDDEAVEVTAAATGLNVISNYYRERMRFLCERWLAPLEADVLQAMLLGDKSSLDEERYRDFQQTGLVHIFAVSGLHVGFIILFCAGLGSMLNLSRRGRFCCTLIIILFYGQVVGWPVSVQRAVIMASLGLLAHYVGRVSKALNCLGIAGLCIIIPSPMELFGAGFQLSFLAAWGLVWIFPVLRKLLPVQHRLLDLVLVPFCAQIAVLPVIAFHYNLITPVSWIGNIFVTYLAGGVVIMGFLTLLLAVPCSWLGPLFLVPGGIMIEILLKLVECFRNLPLAYLYVAAPACSLLFLYYTGVLCAVLCNRFKNPRRCFGAGMSIIAATVVILLIPAGWYHRGELEVVFLEVGQGDSILIKSPQGKFILVDGGGSEFTEIGRRKVLPYLHYRGIRQLFMVVSTHPDTDHLRGLEEVLDEMRAGYVVLPASLDESPAYSYICELATAGRVRMVPVDSEDKIVIEKDFSFRVLGPDNKPGQENYTNEQSLIFSLKYRDFSVLFTGDAGTGELQPLINNLDISPLTVIKVPHHGSRNSLLEGFYENIHPALAVISAGKGNPFGHPHQEVLDALEEQGSRVFRTDRDGAVLLRSDGKRLQVHTFKDQI